MAILSKEQILKRKKIRIVVSILVAFILVIIMVFSLRSCTSKGLLSNEAKTIISQYEKNPKDATLQQAFVIAVIRNQEQLDFSSRYKNEELLKIAQKAATSYLKTNEAWQVTLALGRIHFQLAGIHNKKGNLVGATSNASKGIQILEELLTQDPDNIVVRIYATLNFLSLPNIFEKAEDGETHLNYLLEKISNSNFETELAIEDPYYIGALHAALDKGLEYYKKLEKDTDTLEMAIKKIDETKS